MNWLVAEQANRFSIYAQEVEGRRKKCEYHSGGKCIDEAFGKSTNDKCNYNDQ